MVTLEQPRTMPMRAGLPLDDDAFGELRRRLVLDACKWDPQVGDVEMISRFPIFLPAAVWSELSTLAEQLSSELMNAERELIARPELYSRLGLPRGLRRLLGRAPIEGITPSAARSLRFDFHRTDQGWKISEVNSDVPGGYSEASELPALMAAHYPGTRPAGHPGSEWADAIAVSAKDGNPIALISAAGYMEDRQVLAYLARLLERRDVKSIWIDAKHLIWRNGIAHHNNTPLAAIVRFYQAEWLDPRKMSALFVGGKTPVANPGTAALTESKRFPLVWPDLKSSLPTWQALLPETRDPRQAPWQNDESWLVKSAMCNTGDTVAIRSLMNHKDWNRIRRAIWFGPGKWIAQRRFNALPMNSPVGDIYPCIGVYTINGNVAGIYGRYSVKPLIDFAAVDVAVLIEEGQGNCRWPSKL